MESCAPTKNEALCFAAATASGFGGLLKVNDENCKDVFEAVFLTTGIDNRAGIGLVSDDESAATPAIKQTKQKKEIYILIKASLEMT